MLKKGLSLVALQGPQRQTSAPAGLLGKLRCGRPTLTRSDEAGPNPYSSKSFANLLSQNAIVVPALVL